MPIPPGIVFLAPRVPYLLVPPAAVYVVDRLLKLHANVAVPSWVLAAAYIVSWPAAVALIDYWYTTTVARRAAATGAVMPPKIKSTRFLGLDIMQQMAKDRASHWSGTECLLHLCIVI